MPYQGTLRNSLLCPTSHLPLVPLFGHLGDMIPNNLRSLRKLKGVSQDALAEAAGTTRNYYGKMERGTRPLTFTYLEKLAEALNVEPYRIIAPAELFPTEEQLSDMLQLAQQRLPAGLPYSEWPRTVAADLHMRLLTLAGDRANADSEDAP